MEPYQIKIIETLVVLIFYFSLRKILFRAILKTIEKKQYLKSRGKTIEHVLNILFTAISSIIILIVWGVKTSELSIFLGSTLTIIGVAFFAQWSLLSNITASVILFFSHPIKLNDLISIMEAKDYELKGKVIKIGILFITLRTEDNEDIILPNNIFIQKSIKKKH
jgi:small-conductance mechanosensitive channel